MVPVGEMNGYYIIEVTKASIQHNRWASLTYAGDGHACSNILLIQCRKNLSCVMPQNITHKYIPLWLLILGKANN